LLRFGYQQEGNHASYGFDPLAIAVVNEGGTGRAAV